MNDVNKWIIAPYARNASWSDGVGGIFGAGYFQKILNDRNAWEVLVEIAAEWSSPRGEDEIRSIMTDKHKDLTIEDIDRWIEFLMRNNFLMRQNTFNPNDRYSRNHLYYSLLGLSPRDAQHRIQRSKVIILGCGGIGNHISTTLATCGVGHLVLVDDDTIEISNLTRQILFTEKDVGNSKVATARREIEKRNSEVVVETIEMKISNESDLSMLPVCDIIILSADSPKEITGWVNSYCVENEIPYIAVGYINDISVIGPFYVPKKTSCFACANVSGLEDYQCSDNSALQALNEHFRPATFAPVNGVAAYYAVTDIIKFLSGSDELNSANKRIGIHSISPTFEFQEMPKNYKCSVCSSE